ncbi:helix-turn-helix domain-containing protein [Agromyces sp. SYSU T00194]|uniref:helix-turn-helix domain-containing protein n=1 Tax=Agromyces chitinivorans TaxID=3158560 RepID=UPI003391DEFC
MGDVVDFGTGRRMPAGAPPPLWRDVVGEFLRHERLAQERILTEVARRAGVSPQYLSEVERGRKEPSSEVLEAVAGALGLDLAGVVHAVGERLAGERRTVDLTAVTDAPGGTGLAPASAPAQPVLLAA